MEGGEGNRSSTADFKEPVGGGKRDRHPCPDSGKEHTWICKETSCADCWDPPCEPNRKKEQDDYDAKQSKDDRSTEQKLSEFKAHADAEIAAGKDPVGLGFEKQALDAVGADAICHYAYKAHCPQCHVQGELDIVTHTQVIECKNSASGFKLDQINDNIRAIQKQCFPNHKLVFSTRSSQIARLESKLRQWQQQGHIAEYTTLAV